MPRNVMYDWECSAGHVFEAMAPTTSFKKKCSCGRMAKKIISGRGALNETPAWMKKTLEVIDKDDPQARELLKTGSRTALKHYMKAKGLRFLDDGEKTITSEDREKAFEAHEKSILKGVWDLHQRDQRIEI